MVISPSAPAPTQAPRKPGDMKITFPRPNLGVLRNGFAGFMCASVLAGCTGPGEVESGFTGLTIDSRDSATVLIKVCEAEMNQVLIFVSSPKDPQKDPGGPDNDRVGIWDSKEPLERGVHELRLAAPGSAWRTKTQASLDLPGRMYAIGASDSASATTAGLEVSSEEIAKLTRGQVLVGNDPVRKISRRAFTDLPCER